MNFYIHDETSAFRLEIRGDLCATEAKNCEAAWRTAASTIGDRELVIDVRSLSSVDVAGCTLLAQWRQAGARFIAASVMIRTVIRTIVGVEAVLVAGDAAPVHWQDIIDSTVARSEVSLHSSGAAARATPCSEHVRTWEDSAVVSNANGLSQVRAQILAGYPANRTGEFCSVQVDDHRLYTVSREARAAYVPEFAAGLRSRGVISEIFTITWFLLTGGRLIIERKSFGLASRVPAPIRWAAALVVQFSREKSLAADLRCLVASIEECETGGPSAASFEPVFVDAKACDPGFQGCPGNPQLGRSAAGTRN
jgi:anti-anti-sigma regulatory factor